MPVSLEQQRAAVGAMARSAAPRPRSPVGPNWNKWLRASDPMVYKVCVVLLVTIARMVVSSVKQHTEKMKEVVEEGREVVCELASRGKTPMLAMRQRPRAVLTTSLLMILLCGHILQLDISGADIPISAREELVGDRKTPDVREGTKIVFVNQTLLMIAGDVEPNPGPVTLTSDDLATLVNELHEVRDEWYHIGIQLNVPTHDLNCIRAQYMNNPKDCLVEMLMQWLVLIEPSPPTWQRVGDALCSRSVGKSLIGERLKQIYCTSATCAPAESENSCVPKNKALQTKIVKLQRKFTKLRFNVYKLIRDVDVDIFIAGLLDEDVNGQKYHVPFLKEITQGKEKILNIWMELSPYLNFLNYEILQHILFHFNNDKLERDMDEYDSEMDTFFRETKLCDFLECWPIKGETPPTLELREFVIKQNTDWNTCTLHDLDHLKGSLARKLFIPTFAVLLKNASPGSISVTFLVPFSLVHQIKSAVGTIPHRELADLEIKSISINGTICYEDPLLQYTTVLKQLYTSRSPLQPLSDSKPRDLLPFRLARIEKQILSSSDMNRFTRETLRGNMDDVFYKKTAMELGELGVVEDSSQPHVVLIEGAPGTGKTTFAWEQCRQWVEGRVLEDYSIVLLLPLRDNNIRQIRSLPDLFQHSRGQVREEVSRRVAESGGKGCLIWLEAWDELPYDLHKSDSLFTQLIRGIQLPAATIFITSRPWATRDLLEIAGERLSQQTELLALAKEEVENEIRSMILDINSKTNLDRGFDFSQFIESNPMIRTAMYTPVSAAIVEQVFRSVPHNPPTTVTQLYSAYVLLRLEQHLSQHHKYSHMKMKVRTLADLPEEVMGDLKVLCHLAYEGVSQQMIVFSSLPEGVSTLGLLQTVPQVYDEGEDRVSYNFLHYTVQEYLAALHLSHLPPHKLRTIIYTNYLRMVNTKYGKEYYEATQYKTTFQFLAGITKLEPFPVDFLSFLLKKDGAAMYRWLYESKNQSLLTSVLGSGERVMRLPSSATTTDYFAAGYCLTHSNCTWNIGFDYTSIDDVGMEFFSKGCNHQIPETGISCQLVTVSFWFGSITGEGVGHFSTIPNSLLQQIQYLNLSSNNLDRRGCDLLAEGVQRMPCLERLYLSGNQGIGCGGIVQLMSSLHNSKLRKLGIRRTGISDPDFESLANYIHSTSSLEVLEIGGNEISVESMDSLCRALSTNSSMRILDMSYCDLTTSHCVCLGQLLRHPIHCQIEELYLRWCKLTSDGVGEVMSGLSNNRILRELNLSYNQIGLKGAVAMAIMLKTNSSLERLSLRKCGIDSSGGVVLGAALEMNKTLGYLNLSDNTVGDEVVKGLCVGLENNSLLEELNLFDDMSQTENRLLLLRSYRKRKEKPVIYYIYY